MKKNTVSEESKVFQLINIRKFFITNLDYSIVQDTRYSHTITRAFFSKLKTLKQEKESRVWALYGSETNKDFLKFQQIFTFKNTGLGIPNKPHQFKALSTQKQGKHNFQLLKGILMQHLKRVSWKFNIFVANFIAYIIL